MVSLCLYIGISTVSCQIYKWWLAILVCLSNSLLELALCLWEGRSSFSSPLVNSQSNSLAVLIAAISAIDSGGHRWTFALLQSNVLSAAASSHMAVSKTASMSQWKHFMCCSTGGLQVKIDQREALFNDENWNPPSKGDACTSCGLVMLWGCWLQRALERTVYFLGF